ncbi:hypothetical protein, partial [Gordonia sp. OPL2]|uniref:hypothetical protein n=1 Tax=Gordonia sp. OPL2 TaxID=2486274 RepID=UPI001CA39E20
MDLARRPSPEVRRIGCGASPARLLRAARLLWAPRIRSTRGLCPARLLSATARLWDATRLPARTWLLGPSGLLCAGLLVTW